MSEDSNLVEPSGRFWLGCHRSCLHLILNVFNPWSRRGRVQYNIIFHYVGLLMKTMFGSSLSFSEHQIRSVYFLSWHFPWICPWENVPAFKPLPCSPLSSPSDTLWIFPWTKPLSTRTSSGTPLSNAKPGGRLKWSLRRGGFRLLQSHKPARLITSSKWTLRALTRRL